MSNFKNLISHLLQQIALFFRNLPKEAKDAVAIGNKVVDNLKNFKGEITALEQVIPGDVPTKVFTAIENALPVIMQDLQLVVTCTADTTPLGILNCAKKVLDSLSGKTAQFDFFDSLATQIGTVAGEVLSDGKITWDDIKYVMKYFNDHIKQTALPNS